MSTMKLKNNKFYILKSGVVLLLMPLLACSTQNLPCYEPVTPYVNIQCAQKDANATVDFNLPNANWSCIDIDSAKKWYLGIKATNKFSIILKPLIDTCRWVIQADSAISPLDTISFIYQSNLHFYSNACGYGYDFTLKDIKFTRNTIDSIAIINTSVSTKANNENIKIFF